jgi:hypothetical protein
MTGWEGTIGAIIGAALAALVAWILGRRKARAEPLKMQAEASEAISGAAKIMLDQLRLELNRLVNKVAVLEADLLVLRVETQVLREKLVEAVAEIARLTMERDELLCRVQRLENGEAA